MRGGGDGRGGVWELGSELVRLAYAPLFCLAGRAQLQALPNYFFLELEGWARKGNSVLTIFFRWRPARTLAAPPAIGQARAPGCVGELLCNTIVTM